MKSNTTTGIVTPVIHLALAVGVCLCFALAPASAAPGEEPNPETVAAVKKLMATLKVKEQMGPALDGVRKMQEAMLDQQQLSEEEKESAKEVMAASMEEVQKVLSWESMEKMMVRVYAKVLTTEEVNGMIQLFESPAGQTYVNKQPELQAATMQEMQKIMVELVPKIQEKTQAAIERIKNKQN